MARSGRGFASPCSSITTLPPGREMTANSDEKRMDAVSSCSFQRTIASRCRSPSPYLRQGAVLRNCLCWRGIGPFHAPRSRARNRTLDRAGRRSRGARAPQKTSTRSLMWGATAGRAIGCPIEPEDARAAREPHKKPASEVLRGARPPGAQSDARSSQKTLARRDGMSRSVSFARRD